MSLKRLNDDPPLFEKSEIYTISLSLGTFGRKKYITCPKTNEYNVCNVRNNAWAREKRHGPSRRVFRRGSSARVRESHYATLLSFPSSGNTLDVLCYRERGLAEPAAKGRNTLSSSSESLIRIYQKDWLLHCGPRSASVLLAIAIRTQRSLATNINVPRDAAARSQCASQSL